jgi:hypothetical protein
MQVEAGVLHLENKGIEVEASIVWDLEQGGPIYGLKDGKIFMSLTTEELKALYVLYRDIELKGTVEDA